MLFRYLIYFLIQLIAGLSIAHAQQIQGVLVDRQTGKPVVSASVLLKSAEGKILSFKASDSKGQFLLADNKPSHSNFLEVNHLGYKKLKHELNGQSRDIKLQLEPGSTLLDSIKIKSKPAIQRIGDTLSYQVSSFSNGMDRNIGDVLKRMPGIEVSESGAIKYQGKAISKFYIDGDDLLDDRYSIGTRTIPHRIVQDVQILQNHEPLKVLQHKNLSDDVALNLVIKEEAKLNLSGEMKLGAGFPKQYDGEINSLLFNKKHKLLNVLQGNNVGNDLSNEFTGFNQAGILSKLNRSNINNLLSLGTVAPPAIPERYYLDNKHVSLNANNLVNLSKDWQLKSNIQAMYGARENDYQGQRSYLTESGSINFDENQQLHATEWISSIRLNAKKNTEKQYLQNALILEYEQESAHAQILSNAQNSSGRTKQHIRGFSNQLNYNPLLKNQAILSLDWYLHYGNKPQTLTLEPGPFADQLNQGIPYFSGSQFVEVPSLFSSAALGYRLPSKKIQQNYQFAALMDQQQLRSHIDLMQNQEWKRLDLDSSINQMDWNRYQFTGSGQFDWNNKRLGIRLFLPFVLQAIQYTDPGLNIQDKQWKPLFNPSLAIKLKVGKEDELAVNALRENSVGNIDQVYRGLIIQNYRNLNYNLARLNESNSNSVGIKYQLARTIKLFFLNVGLDYRQTSSSSMLSSSVSEDQSQSQLIDRENQIQTLSASTGIDKYLFGWSSSIKIQAGWSMTDFNQLFNDELLAIKQYSYRLSPKLETKLWKSINLSYNATFNWMENRQDNLDIPIRRTSFSLNQELGLPLYFMDALHIRMSGRHLFSQQEGFRDMNYLFLDGFIRYRLKDWRTDFELNMSNLANIKTMHTYSLSGIMEAHNQYPLRGRTLVLKAVFNFK